MRIVPNRGLENLQEGRKPTPDSYGHGDFVSETSYRFLRRKYVKRLQSERNGDLEERGAMGWERFRAGVGR